MLSPLSFTVSLTFTFANRLRVRVLPVCRVVNVASNLPNLHRKISTVTMDLFEQAQQLGAEKHSKSHEQFIPYGTAGFRARAIVLDHIMFRMGLLAALRSRSKSAAIGVMVTASHNPVEDNGVKLVDPLGEMLDPHWEKLAMELANAPDVELGSSLAHIVKAESIDMSKNAEVFVGEDTRPSSDKFSAAVQEGAKALQAKVTPYGVITTPMLHFFVASHNLNGTYGEPNEKGYFDKLTDAFKIFHNEVCSEEKTFQEYDSNIICDAANGVGALKMVPLQQRLSGLLNFELVNTGDGELNKECGADYVKTRQQKPKNVKNRPKNRCVSFDGDADRIVYFYEDATPTFHLLDGDRIATLVASFLKELVDKMGLDLNLGVVQTAYANGASTKYIEEVLKLPVACVPTGVKHLHHKAQEFDIGVYFEANGHGTVVFNNKVKKAVKEIREEKRYAKTALMKFSGAKRGAARKMLALIDLTNETVGDAISDLLLVESILHARGWTVEDWENTYKDLPNRQIKVTVLDRNVIETSNADRTCESPPGLQEAIDNLVKNFDSGRAFARPSGTEDIVRVYAEASSQSNADKLAVLVARAVHKMAGGYGDPPTHMFK